MYRDPETGALANGVAKVRYTHDAMIDILIAEPTIKQNDLAAMFDRSPTWVSLIMSSDAFQARLAERRAQIIDPALSATLDERLRSVANKALEKVLDRLTGPLPTTDDFLLQSAKLATGALGYGARVAGGAGQTNVAVVIQVPQKAPTSTEWLAQVQPAGV